MVSRRGGLDRPENGDRVRRDRSLNREGRRRSAPSPARSGLAEIGWSGMAGRIGRPGLTGITGVVGKGRPSAVLKAPPAGQQHGLPARPLSQSLGAVPAPKGRHTRSVSPRRIRANLAGPHCRGRGPRRPTPSRAHQEAPGDHHGCVAGLAYADQLPASVPGLRNARLTLPRRRLPRLQAWTRWISSDHPNQSPDQAREAGHHREDGRCW